MKCLVFVALVASSYAATTSFTWSDCGKPPSGQANSSSFNTPVQFNYLSLSPSPVLFPGYVTVGSSITINRPITALYVDMTVKRETVFGQLEFPLVYYGTPLILEIGSGQNVDVCSLLRDVHDDTSTGPDGYGNDLGKHIQAILASTLGNLPQCPIQPADIIMTSKTIHLRTLPTSLISDGDYHVTLTLKESTNSTESVGCLDVHFGIERDSTGFLFG